MVGLSTALTGLIIFCFSVAGVGLAPTEFGGRDKDWLTYTIQCILMIGVIGGILAILIGLILSVWGI